MSRVTDHTRTEKIDGDSILFFLVNQVVAGNRYDKEVQDLDDSTNKTDQD